MLSALETVERKEGKKKVFDGARIFPACFSKECDRSGVGRLAPDWWMRGVTRSGVRNAPFSGSFSKGGGARNGAERRAEPGVI